MGARIQSYDVGEILEVVELESEALPSKKSFRKLRSYFPNSSRNRWMVLGIAGIAIVFLVKAWWLGLVYREEWIVGGCAALSWLLGIKLAFDESLVSRLWGRTIVGMACLLWMILVAAAFHPAIANRLAMHWLFRSGFQVNSGLEILGEDYVAAYTRPVTSLSIGSVDGQLPARVLSDLDLKFLSIDLSASSTSKFDSRSIRNIAKVSPLRPGVFSLSAGPLNQLSDDDLRAMTQAGLVVPTFKITSGCNLRQSVMDYLLAPNITPLNGINCENLYADDLKMVEKVAAAKGKFRFMSLTDCLIDDQTAASIANSAVSVFLNSVKPDTTEIAWCLTAAELDVLIKNKVPVLNLNVASLTKDQCAGLIGNGSLSVINVKDLDGESVELLAMTSVQTVGLDFLSEDAAQSMIRNRVRWTLSVDKTNAEYDTLLRLIQMPTLNAFYLQSKSQFTLTQQENLEK